jgi:hypothetical protein
MKNLILITLLFVVFRGEAQTTKPIDGFLGIKFGSSAAQVTEALKAKGAVVNANPTDQSVGFSNGSLGGRKTSALFVHFVNDQVYEAEFVFKPELEDKTIEYYNNLVTNVNDAYGPGKPHKEFKQPYSDGDGYEITAIKTGNATYYTGWVDGNNNTVEISITTNAEKSLRVRIFYTNDKLYKLSQQQQKEKNKSEF